MSSSTFALLGTPADLVDRLLRHGISEPFPIQTVTLPDAFAGRDICGRAPTGSGKTIAFGIPLVAGLAAHADRRPRGLVLVPTRELAAQVTSELRMLAGTKGPSVLAVYGGVGFGEQVNRLRRGVDIVVACPGRLSDLIRRRNVTLDGIKIAVIDEADRMADMGFLPEVRQLLDMVPSERQTLLFSATLDGDVDVLVRRYQRNPARHDLEPEHAAHLTRHVFWNAARADRVDLLSRVLATQSPAIVFCRTKHGADRLAKQLTRAGVSVAALHGNRSQAQRTRALAAFTDGAIHALVATDVAARGIHVDDVAVVVHFDPPATDKDYIHRSGRTGRAGRTGIVLSFVDRDQHKATVVLQRQLGLGATIERPDVADLHPVRRQSRTAARSRRAPSSPARVRTHGGQRVSRGR